MYVMSSKAGPGSVAALDEILDFCPPPPFFILDFKKPWGLNVS